MAMLLPRTWDWWAWQHRKCIPTFYAIVIWSLCLLIWIQIAKKKKRSQSNMLKMSLCRFSPVYSHSTSSRILRYRSVKIMFQKFVSWSWSERDRLKLLVSLAWFGGPQEGKNLNSESKGRVGFWEAPSLSTTKWGNRIHIWCDGPLRVLASVHRGINNFELTSSKPVCKGLLKRWS